MEFVKWITNGLRWRGPNSSQQVSLPMCHSVEDKRRQQTLRSTLQPEEGIVLLSNEVRIQEAIAAAATQENINFSLLPTNLSQNTP